MRRVRSTSKAALLTAPTASLREKVLSIIEGFGDHGCITDDVIAEFLKTDKTNTGSITGRFSELEEAGLMFRKGDTRPGVSGKRQSIMRHIRYAPPGYVAPLAMPKTRNPFLAGMIHATKLLLAADDIPDAKVRIKAELMRVAKKSKLTA